MATMRRPLRRGAAADLLVVGLGNPGSEYAGTRHNVGQWVVDELVRRHGDRLRRARTQPARVAELSIAGRPVAVAVPVTYVNESGRAVGPLLRRYGIIDIARLVIVHDELDLPVGRLRVKVGGGLAGHNGLKSIRAHVRSDAFARVRIGIGRPARTPRGGGYVLARPGRTERAQLDDVVARAADAVEHYGDHTIAETMSRYNAAS